MEAIRNAEGHTVCEVDPDTGMVVHRYGKRMTIFFRVPVGGEVMFETQSTCTVILRDSLWHMRVSRVHRERTG